MTKLTPKVQYLLLIGALLFSTVNYCFALAIKLPNTRVLNNTMPEYLESSMNFSDFERQIAAKMALDIRYFCQGNAKPKKRQCLEPVTKLPSELAEMITETGIGGVVLFAENFETTSQTIQLTHDLQKAAIQSKSKQPLIISVDQEGGRVVRLPQATAFAGNMAIGATYLAHGTKYASETSRVIGKELKLLGINNNYAPVVDVNTNAKNPVINTRSYGENSQRVSELGVAAVQGFQEQGIMATLKHFPGHGDTHVDSHLGLPIVEHDLDTIKKNDIAPFQWAIQHSDPAMIMTAHIQYPALDNSTIENNKGDKVIRPATMSRKILTDLLRNKMGFTGIIATDALDMAGISHYFDQVTAVVETFTSGADIAVMPFKIRKNEDIESFYLFIKAVAKNLQQKMQENTLLSEEFMQSINRINRYKDDYIKITTTTLSTKITIANQKISQKKHLELEQSLSDDAIVLLANKQNLIPLDFEKTARIHLLVLNWQEFRAMKQAIVEQWQEAGKSTPEISATVVSEPSAQRQIHQGEKLAKADILIATVDTKIASAVDKGGAEDLLTTNDTESEINKVSYEQLLSLQLQQAKKTKVPSILIVKGSPYLVKPYKELATAILVTFDDRIYQQHDNLAVSPGYSSSMRIAYGIQKAHGKLPVSLPEN